MKVCIIQDCENLVEGNTDRCATHNKLARKIATERKKEAEKRELMFSKSKPVYKKPNKVSPKRKEENEEYLILREKFLQTHPECEINANEYCTKISTDVHHPAGRVGLEYLNAKRWKSACRSCHAYAHDHPLEAKEKGWSESRLSNNRTT